MDHLCYFCLVLLYFHARLFVDALWSPAYNFLIECKNIKFPSSLVDNNLSLEIRICGFKFASFSIYDFFIIYIFFHDLVHCFKNAVN